MGDSGGNGSLWIIVLIVIAVVMVSFTSNQMMMGPTRGTLPDNERVDNINVTLTNEPNDRARSDRFDRFDDRFNRQPRRPELPPPQPPSPPTPPPTPPPRRPNNRPTNPAANEIDTGPPYAIPPTHKKYFKPAQPDEPPPSPVIPLTPTSRNKYMLHTVDLLKSIDESPEIVLNAHHRFYALLKAIRKKVRGREKDEPDRRAKGLQLFRSWELLRNDATDLKHSDFLWTARQDSDMSNQWAKHMLRDRTACSEIMDVVHNLENHLLTRYVTIALLDFNRNASDNTRDTINDAILLFFQLTALIISHDHRCCGLNERIAASWIETEHLRNALASVLAIMFIKLTHLTMYPAMFLTLALLCKNQPSVTRYLERTFKLNESRLKDVDLVPGVELATRIFPNKPRALSQGDLTRDRRSKLIYIEVPEALASIAGGYSPDRTASVVRNVWFQHVAEPRAQAVLFVNNLFRPLPYTTRATWNRAGVLSIFESRYATDFNDLAVDSMTHGMGYKYRDVGMFELSSRNMFVCKDARLNQMGGSLTQQLFERMLTNEGTSSVSVVSFIATPHEEERTMVVSRADIVTKTKWPGAYANKKQRGAIVHHTFNLYQFTDVGGPHDFHSIELRYVILPEWRSIVNINTAQLSTVSGRTEASADKRPYLLFDVPAVKNRMGAQFYMHNRKNNERFFFELTTTGLDGQQSTMPADAINVDICFSVSATGGVAVRVSHLRNLTKVNSVIMCACENSRRALETMDAIRKFSYYAGSSGTEVKYSGQDYEAAIDESCRSLETNYIK